jgi:hypothetical protein
MPPPLHSSCRLPHQLKAIAHLLHHLLDASVSNGSVSFIRYEKGTTIKYFLMVHIYAGPMKIDDAS